MSAQRLFQTPGAVAHAASRSAPPPRRPPAPDDGRGPRAAAHDGPRGGRAAAAAGDGWGEAREWGHDWDRVRGPGRPADRGGDGDGGEWERRGGFRGAVGGP